MTAATSTPAGTADAPAVHTPTLRARLRSGRVWIFFGVLAVLGALVIALVQGGMGIGGQRLGADDASPQGARALVEVLGSRGVAVTVASSLDAATDAASGATVLLFDELGLLDEQQLERLIAVGDETVIVEPSFSMLGAVAPGVSFAGIASDSRPAADCSLLAARHAGELSAGLDTFSLGDDAEGWIGCFADDEAGYALVTRPGTPASLTLLGSAEILENGTIAEAGNAALALNLLGSRDRLVWYLPGLADVDDAPTLGEITPGWVSPAIVLLITTTIVAAVWRGRRFGPLVVEDLPVVVRASETMEGRARLYARSSARLRALDTLRVGAAGRLARHLGLASTTTIDEIADAAAAVLGENRALVRALLLEENPGDDRMLVDRAARLSELETRVAAATRPDTTGNDGTRNTARTEGTGEQ